MEKGIRICAKFSWSPIITLITWARSYRYAKLSAIGGDSARYMQDGVGVFRVLLQRLDRFDRRQDEQFDPAAQSLALYFVHHRQSSICPRADHKSAAFPRNLLFDGKRRMTEFVTKFF